MNFNNFSYFLPIIGFLLIFYFFYFKYKKAFLSWIEDHWFYRPSLSYKLSTFFYVIGLTLITLALLDLRGPEKRVKGTTQDQKTIILIDSSASMLAEDVRPNRFNKALLLVKHFVKKAVGQQISLVVFSDNQKRIIPFTKDTDLINARIGSLESLNIGRGGTSLSQAIQESVAYFKSSQGELSGNILIFTDAEETELNFDIKIPKEITVAMVGVGTLKGSPIPMRNSRGEFKGNKKFKGKVVISKLNEKVLKGLSDKIANYKYWIATSYSLPTEEIVSFFNRIEGIKKSESEYRIRPVLSNYLLIPGALAFIISFFLGFRKTFVMSFALLFLNLGVNAQAPVQEGKEPVKSEETNMLESLFVQNKLDYEGKKKLAANLLGDGFPEQSSILYEEVLSKNLEQKELQDQSNYALSQISSGKKAAGIDNLERLLSHLKKENYENGKSFLDQVEKNLLKAIEDSSSKGDGKGKKEKNKEKNKNKDQNKDESEQNEGSGEDQKKPKDGDQEGKEKKKSDSESKDEKDSEDDENKSKEEKQKDSAEENKNKSLDKKKLPAILKQLINDDNQLQKKAIDAKTVERKNRDRKDW